ncbi:MAG: FtsQ-type POTRA domain-containing protein [Candidatus Atribacteria bacterium]
MEIVNENEEEKELEEEEEEEGKESQHFGVKITKILIFYLIIGFLSWNFFNFIFSSKFCNIEEVVIKGNDYLSEDEIFSKSQIKLGENIFKLDLKKSIELLKQEPRIKELEIKRIIPNKIIISLKEREGAAIVYISEECFILSKEGIVLSKIDKQEGLVIPLISGLKIARVKIGETIDEPEFRTALEIINSANVILPKEFYKVKIFASDDFLLFNIDDTLKIRVNKPEEIINKGNLLREALGKIIKEKLSVEYIDMRFKDSVIIKVKN